MIFWTVYTCWLCGDRPQGAVQQKKSFETFILRIGAGRQRDMGWTLKLKAELAVARLVLYHRKCNLDGLPAQLFSLKPRNLLNKQEIKLVHFPELVEHHQRTFLSPNGFDTFHLKLPTCSRSLKPSTSPYLPFIWIFKNCSQHVAFVVSPQDLYIHLKYNFFKK